MNSLSALVPLPVMLPLMAAALTLLMYRRPRVQRWISVITLSLILLIAIALVFLVDDGPIVTEIGNWSAPIGINLVADRLSSLMLAVSAAVTLGVLLYSLSQGQADGNETGPLSIYHPTYLVLTAGVANAFLSGDLFNIYVGFEILLAASYVLLTLGGTSARIRAGAIYVVVAMVSSVLFLLAIATTYAAAGTVNLAQLAQRLPELDPGIQTLIQVLLLLAFGIKAAIFPLSAWLPDSYPTAPAPVTAVFAGLLTKVGVYAIIRVQTLLFPESQINDVLLYLSLLTMVVGILGAVAQDDIKRLLSFTLVSHIGFMLFGIAIGSQAGMTAAVFYVVHHITVQTALFLVVGLIERRTGLTSLDELGGLARITPVLAVLFFIPAVNLAGIPPFSGFLGKIGLIQAGVAENTGLAYLAVAAMVVTSLLTLYALVKAWNKAFWQDQNKPLPNVSIPIGMYIPSGVLVGVGFLIALGGGPLYSYTERAATALLDPAFYIEAVLPDGERGPGESARAAAALHPDLSPTTLEGAGE